MQCLTAEAPVNIAVVKYWGKRDDRLILPTNGSISVTLDLQDLHARTTIAISKKFARDRIWLNGREQSIENPRLQTVLQEVRRRARKRHQTTTDGDNSIAHVTWNIHICSENNFPTAAGLASSAAGFACLTFALAKLFNLDEDISIIARQGSGSACRSVFGGFVEWLVGERDDGLDSVARQIATETHWSNLHVLILVVSSAQKHVGSTDAMQLTVKTSQLLHHRAKHIVPAVLDDMKAAILARDFSKFAELTMKESNQMHATCLDTYPPVNYLTDTSHNIIRLVHAINQFYKDNRVAYTFDAGPNACLYLLEENVNTVLGLVQHFFPPRQSDAGRQSFITGLAAAPVDPSPELLASIPLQPSTASVQYVIHTKVGGGPRVLRDDEACLLNTEGLPHTLNS